MRVIIEGPDGSGKSTLAALLSQATGLRVQCGEGPEKYPGEMNERARRWLDMHDQPIIFDRHPCISHPIYSQYTRVTRLGLDLVSEFYTLPSLIVYCRSPGIGEGHEEKGYDNPAHLEAIKHFDRDIRDDYNEWAGMRAHIIYDLTRDDPNRVVNSILAHIGGPRFDPLGDIERFHIKYGLEYTGLPRILPADLADFRSGFMREELDEWNLHQTLALSELTKADVPDPANYTYHLEEQLDALLDLIYVTLGTAYLQGFSHRIIAEGWRRVQAANMAKVRAAQASESKRGSAFDVVKPKGWTPPYHTDLIEVNDFGGRTE